MLPSDILKNEHIVINQVLACLEKLIANAKANNKLDGPSAREALDFFQNFADRCHHGKEEDHYFPAMEAKGFQRHGGPTGVMLSEHEIGRKLVRAMIDSSKEAEEGNAEALALFSHQGTSFIDLLREHIEKEDHCLFTMGDQALSADEQKDLMAKFEKVQREDLGEDMHPKYVEVANKLADRLGVPRQEVRFEG